MTPSERAVVIEQLPESCNGNESREFVRRIQSRVADLVRPAVVLDCSQVRHIDKGLVYLLFSCLEEAMKRNGDVRLASVRPEAWPALDAAGVGRLFRIFASNTEAASSYRQPPVYRIAAVPASTTQAVAKAA